MTRHVVEGFTLPDRSKYLTAEEMAWLSFLRDLHWALLKNSAGEGFTSGIQAVRQVS